MTVIFAHRGASALLPEHTRAAYERALADGADGVECDVHLTAEGEVVLLHDDTLDRTSDGTGPVAAHSLAELRALDFWSWKGGPLPGGASLSEQLLTLDDLLDVLLAAGRPVALAIEFKHGAEASFDLEDTALAVLARRGWDPVSGRLGTVAVSFMSFAAAAVAHLLATVPGRHLCQLVDAGCAEGDGRLDDGTVGIAGPGLAFVAAYPDRVREWTARGVTARVWTVDTAADLRTCRALGVAEVTTNDPAGIRALLREYGGQ